MKDRVVICKHWKDYNEPQIGLREWCSKLKSSTTCNPQDSRCYYFEGEECEVVKIPVKEVSAEPESELWQATKSFITHYHQGNLHPIDLQRISEAVRKMVNTKKGGETNEED